jgi:glycosyltransferase involved in cell wall biosynthesis
MALHFGARPETLVRRCQAAALPETYNAATIPALRAEAKPPAPSFLYVGRLSSEKNLSRLIAAFARVATGAPDARLRLAGDGPLRADLTEQVRSLRLEHVVSFLGGLDQAALGAEYLRATALVLPSLREPWGLVVNEALSHGCPVLVSEACGCVPELVKPGLSGLSFPPHDIEAMCDGMLTLLREPPTAESCLAIIADFTPEAAARNILDGVRAYVSRRDESGATLSSRAA